MSNESITSSSVFNSFNVFRELFKGISALSTLNPKFAENGYYFEDMPDLKAGNFQTNHGFPFVLIETEMDAEALTLDKKRVFTYTTTVTIFTEYHIEKVSNNLNGYLNAIVNYFYANKQTLRWTYKLKNLEISKNRSTDVVHQKKLVLGELTFNYSVTLDTSS